MTGDAVIQLIGAIGGASVVTAVANAILNRRKMSADVTEVIQKAAGGAVELVQQDNVRLRLEMKQLKDDHAAEISRTKTDHTIEVESLRGANQDLWAKARQLEQENAVLLDVVRDQAAYSRRQTAEIRRLGGEVEDPPELPAALMG